MIATNESHATKVERISALRFKHRRNVENMIGKNGFLTGATVGQDEKGYFAKGDFTINPAVAALPSQAEIDAHKAANPDLFKATPVVERKAPVRKSAGGACEAIRAWTKANPDATKADALAQFPDMNPATVKIQFKKTRDGLFD